MYVGIGLSQGLLSHAKLLENIAGWNYYYTCEVLLSPCHTTDKRPFIQTALLGMLPSKIPHEPHSSL